MNDGHELILLGLVVCIIATFKYPKHMYWIGLVSLFVQSLFFVFKFDQISAIFGDVPAPKWSDGEKLGLWIAVLPFLLPFILAWVTSAISANPLLGLASFTFYSIVQIVVHGVISQQDRLTNKILTGAKLAIPILSFLVNVLRAMAGG